MRRHRTAAAIAATVAVATGCAGPQAPLDVSTQTAQIGLVLGKLKAVVAAPVGAVPPPAPPKLSALPRGSGGALPPGPPTVPAPGDIPDPPPTADCPDFDPTAPMLGAGNTVLAPAQPATYRYRGSYTETVAGTPKVYGGDSSWTVRKPSAPDADGDYTFDVTATMGKVTTTRTFLVVPNGTPTPNAPDPGVDPGDVDPAVEDPVLPAAPDQPGIYLARVSRNDGYTFTPATPMTLAQFPLREGQTFKVVGKDATTTNSYTLTVKPKGRVNACGRPLEGWTLALTDGTVQSRQPDGSMQVVNFAETITLGTQYGGLILADQVAVTPASQVPSLSVSRTESWTINVQPKLPKATG